LDFLKKLPEVKPRLFFFKARALKIFIKEKHLNANSRIYNGKSSNLSTNYRHYRARYPQLRLGVAFARSAHFARPRFAWARRAKRNRAKAKRYASHGIL
jgi:hypothetical protein